MGNKLELYEISIIRPVIIILLVFMHSFTMYAGEWPLPQGINDIRIYFWIQRFAFSSLLEMFVFISGYIFYYQLCELNKKYTLKSLIIAKFKRLIIPSIIFSLLYAFFFYNKEVYFFSFIYDIFSGIAHMWFLPMLFWCFVFSYVIWCMNIKEEYILFILFCCSIISFLPLPFQLTRTMYYLFYFYLAFYVRARISYIQKKLVNPKTIIILFLLFNILFIPFTLLREQIYLHISSLENVFLKVNFFCIANLLKVIYAILGMMLFYISVLFLLKYIVVPSWLISLNSLCMGIYLFHQFILIYLFYYTSVPQKIGAYYLPWLGFVFSLSSSYILTYYVRRTKLGRLIL